MKMALCSSCYKPFKCIFIILLALHCTLQDSVDSEAVSARIESCRGCQLNRLPEVKKFIFEDVPLFEDVVFNPIQGALPELVFLNSQDQELERISLSRLSREECNQLLTAKGFSRKEVPDAASPHTDL